MKSIQRAFEVILEQNPSVSTYIAFSRAITGKKFTKPMISRWFSKLVDKDDYARSEKRALIDYLCELSTP